MNAQKELLPWLDNLISDGERVVGSFQQRRLNERILSNLPDSEIRKFLAIGRAAIERIAGKDSDLYHGLPNPRPERTASAWPDGSIAVLGALQALRDLVTAGLVVERHPIPHEERLIRTLNRFPRTARELQERHGSRSTIEIDDEYDVQDLLRALLRLDFDDIRPEEWTPSYAGRSSRMDFLLKREQIVIEVKMTRRGLGAKEVGDELLVDIGRYRSHPDCRLLVCFVYDPMNKIGNPEGLEADLSRSVDGLQVRVVVAPK